MRLQPARGLGLGLLVVLVLAGFSLFTVDERELAILFRLGKIVRTDFDPGLHVKLPFVEKVRKFERRLMTLDAEPERFLTSEKKNVVVDSFVKWRIGDVARYYRAVRGDELQAQVRLAQVLKDNLRGEFGKRTIQEVISGERAEIMDIVTRKVNHDAKELGIQVVDVRLKRVDLPEDVSDSVFRRMEAERARVARQWRSRGAEAAERIRADADRRRTELLAKAYRDAERIRGEGDARAAAIYAAAFSRDPDFYEFYRSLEAYRAVFKDRRDVLLISPDSQFFRYLRDAGLRPEGAGASGRP
ncbi:MAG: protease modulator HflC [Gammaproteobacteria bacterium]|nr:MAG: protease modulator HflC [Gammaproteobacteria bacterium]